MLRCSCALHSTNPDYQGIGNPGIGGGSGDGVVPETLPESGAAGGGAGAVESAPPVMLAGGVAGAEYRFFVSVDGINWGQPVSTGTLLNVDSEQEILFTP
jgi:hypothetical protein